MSGALVRCLTPLLAVFAQLLHTGSCTGVPTKRSDLAQVA